MVTTLLDDLNPSPLLVQPRPRASLVPQALNVRVHEFNEQCLLLAPRPKMYCWLGQLIPICHSSNELGPGSPAAEDSASLAHATAEATALLRSSGDEGVRKSHQPLARVSLREASS